jgi:hypothetical protein
MTRAKRTVMIDFCDIVDTDGRDGEGRSRVRGVHLAGDVTGGHI